LYFAARIKLHALNRIYLLIIFLFATIQLKAQSDGLQEFTFGAGGGTTKAYAGAAVQKIELAGFIDAGFYFTPFLNINVEEQFGAMGGSSLNYTNVKSFTNNYNATFLKAELQFGQFFDPGQSNFLNLAKGIYIGTGYGLLNGNITNTNIITGATDHVQATVRVLPTTLGYEYSLVNRFNEPIVKFDLLYTFNYTLGKGLDGYFDQNSKAFKFYNYYGIGVKYAISLAEHPGKRRFKLD
jgi:hypothetical protein